MTDPAAATPTAPAPEPGWMRRLTEDEAPVAGPSLWGPVVLLVLGLLWLGGILRSASATIANNGGDAAVAISSAALALPGILTAVLLGGAAAGLLLAVRFARPRTPRATLLGMGGGAAIGVATGALVLVLFGANWAIGVIAITIGIAGLVGGAAAALPPGPVAAGLTATLVYFVFTATLALFQSPLKGLLGAGSTDASQLGAASRLALITALLSGLVIGLVAYVTLRRAAPGGWPWPWYLLAGATPGLVALLAEGLTRLGGSGLLGIVSGFSPADRLVMSYLGAERLKAALIIVFIGGIVAMIAVGRTMRRPT